LFAYLIVRTPLLENIFKHVFTNFLTNLFTSIFFIFQGEKDETGHIRQEVVQVEAVDWLPERLKSIERLKSLERIEQKSKRKTFCSSENYIFILWVSNKQIIYFWKKPYFRCHQSFEYFVWNVSVFVSLINFVEENSVFKKN
jgi:hypothetical protein